MTYRRKTYYTSRDVDRAFMKGYLVGGLIVSIVASALIHFGVLV